MKTFIASIIVLVTMLFGICLYAFYLTNVVDEFKDSINQIQKTATEKQWEECNKNTEELTKKWESRKKVLCFFTDHGDLDEVEKVLRELQTSVRFCNPQDAVKYLAKLHVLMERLVENEMPTLENILRINTKMHNLSYYVITDCPYVQSFI